MTIGQASQLRVGDIIRNDALAAWCTTRNLTVIQAGVVYENEIPVILVRDSVSFAEVGSFVSLSELVCPAYPSHIQVPEGM